MRRKHDTVHETPVVTSTEFTRLKCSYQKTAGAKITYVDAVVVKVWVFVELVGGVVLVSGQEFAQKMAEVVDGLCCHVEGDTRRIAETGYIAKGDIRNKRRSDFGGVQIVKRVTDEVGVG